MSQPLDYESPSPLEAPPPRGALASIVMIVFLDLLGFGIIIPALPFYVPNFKENAIQVGLLFSIYSICQFIASPILGALSDRYGRRPVLIISQLGSVAGYVLLGYATQTQWHNPTRLLTLVYISRIIDGLSGGNISTAQAYVSDVTAPSNRAKGMGMIGAAFGVGFSAGPALGGILGGGDHKYLPAYVAAGFSLVAAIVTYLMLPESRKHKPADVEAWLHPSRFLPVLRKPVLAQLLVIAFLAMSAFVMMEATIGIFLNSVFGFDEQHVGYFFAYAGVVIFFVQGFAIGRLTRMFGEWPLAIAGLMFVSIGMIGFTTLAFVPVIVILLAAGLVNATGRSLHQPTISSLLSKYSDPREQGVVFGLFHGLSSLARVIGPLVAGVMYQTFHHTGQYLTACATVLFAAIWTVILSTVAPRVSVPVRS